MRLLRGKYNVHEMLPQSISRNSCSFVWRSLSHVWPEVLSNIFWSVGDGRLINFWNDNWIKKIRPLRDYSVEVDQLDNT